MTEEKSFLDVQSFLQTAFFGVAGVLEHVLNWLVHRYGKVMLLIDEFAAAHDSSSILNVLTSRLDSEPNFFMFITSLRRKVFDISDEDETLTSNRPVEWQRLEPIEIPEVLQEPTASKHAADAAEFCGGHPRSLELLYDCYQRHPSFSSVSLTTVSLL